MDFESILEDILLGRGQGNLKLKPKQKEALQRSRSCLKIVGATAESLKRALRLSSHDLVQSVVSQTVN